MTTVRVDTYEGLLDSVEVYMAGSPYSLLETVSVGITSLGGGAYTVPVTATGQWLLVLLDSDGNSLGTKYASDVYTQAGDYPPWLLASVDVTVNQPATVVAPELYKSGVVYFYSLNPVELPITILDSDDEAVDYTGYTFDFVIERDDGTKVVEVLAQPGTTTGVLVTLPSIAAESPINDCYTWSLRNSSTNAVVGFGTAVYRYVPIKA